MLGDFPNADGELPLVCQCGQEAIVPTKGRAQIMAIIGMGLVMDGPNPRPDFMPDVIQCRRCARVYDTTKGA